MDADAIAAENSATNAALSATEAQGHANNAASAANFVGIWSNLVGALNVPASVEHEGAIWILLNNLVDVTTSEPGVTSDWLLLNGVKYVVPVAAAELSTNYINNLTTSSTFKYPIAANIQSGITVTVAILEVNKGITPQIDLQGGDSAKDANNTVTDNVTYDASFSGVDEAVCNGVDTWEF